MPSVIHLVTYALAVARLTQLVTADRIADTPRNRVSSWAWQRRLKQRRPGEELEEPYLSYGIKCPWCVSIWIGAVAAPLVYFAGSSPWLFVPALALAFSELAGLMARG